jgi:hypothetical protein
MKKLLVLLLTVSFSVWAAPRDCSAIDSAVKADLKALGKYFEGGNETLKTKSKRPLEMVKEFLVATYDADTAENYDLKKNSKSIPSEGSEAGTTSAKAAKGAIWGTAEEWYLNGDSDDEIQKTREGIESAIEKLFSHHLKYGYDAGAQGWGGSPATNLLFLNPRCKTLYSFFLGITHD